MAPYMKNVAAVGHQLTRALNKADSPLPARLHPLARDFCTALKAHGIQQ